MAIETSVKFRSENIIWNDVGFRTSRGISCVHSLSRDTDYHVQTKTVYMLCYVRKFISKFSTGHTMGCNGTKMESSYFET